MTLQEVKAYVDLFKYPDPEYLALFVRLLHIELKQAALEDAEDRQNG